MFGFSSAMSLERLLIYLLYVGDIFRIQPSRPFRINSPTLPSEGEEGLQVAPGAQDQGPEKVNGTVAGDQGGCGFVTSMGMEGLPSASLLSQSKGICFRTATCTCSGQQAQDCEGANFSVRPHFPANSMCLPTSQLTQSSISYLRGTFHCLSLCGTEGLFLSTHWFHLEKKVYLKHRHLPQADSSPPWHS